jgi:hypothetical protein
MVLYSALSEVINMETLRLYRERNDMGWTLEELGVSFGKLAGLAYILPGARFERGDLQIQFQKQKVQAGLEIKDINISTLVGKPEFRKE